MFVIVRSNDNEVRFNEITKQLWIIFIALAKIILSYKRLIKKIKKYKTIAYINDIVVSN